MSNANHHATPYQPLGLRLKLMREDQRESVAEVSGAVEIDIVELERIEAGHDRPSEDILLLLINHFEVQDQEAVHLWELAGYEEPPVERANSGYSQTNGRQPLAVILAVDVRTMYSDSFQALANDAGVVMQFNQASTSQTNVPIARIGVSAEQAEQVIKTLQAALLKHKYLRGPKGLPQPDEQ